MSIRQLTDPSTEKHHVCTETKSYQNAERDEYHWAVGAPSGKKSDKAAGPAQGAPDLATGWIFQARKSVGPNNVAPSDDLRRCNPLEDRYLIADPTLADQQ